MNLDIPTVQNRRVEQLRGSKSSRIQSDPSSPLIPTFNREVLNELDTPTRESILQRFKEMEEETPQTKRRRYEQAGIKTPECATTPYWMEYKRQQLEDRRMRHAPTQEQIDKIQNRTVSAEREKKTRNRVMDSIETFSQPWSEVKRSLWKAALGDEYESPSQYYSVNMQPTVSHINDTVAPRPTGRALTYEQPGETEADKNIQALADFIKQGKKGNNEPAHYADLPNTAPFESGLFNQHISIFAYLIAGYFL